MTGPALNEPELGGGDADPEPLLRWSQAVAAVPLLLAVVGATVVYWPAFNAPFVADDYVYLHSVRALSFWHYVRVSLPPGSHDETLILVDNFWRPAYFLSFQVTVRLFGEHLWAYHLLNFAIHLAAIALVWLVAWRLTRRALAAGVAAVVFAVHPAGMEAVAWISSVNSVAVPLGLGAWLLFMSAVERSDRGETARRWYVAAFAVLMLAVAFHESAFAVCGAMAAWLVLVQRRRRWRDWRAYLPLAPYVVAALAYLALRTHGFSQAVSEDPVFQLSTKMPERWWYYIKLALFPLGHSDGGWRLVLERVGGVAVIVALPVALLLRRWTLAAVLLAFMVSLVSYSGLKLGVSPRYFYGPSAFLAIALGIGVAEAMGAARRVPAAAMEAAVVAGCAVIVAAGAYAGHARVGTWADDGPATTQAWVDALQAKFPVVPAGGTLYVANPPLVLVLFGNVFLQPTVSYYYPDVGPVVVFDEKEFPAVEAKAGPNDRVFVFH